MNTTPGALRLGGQCLPCPARRARRPVGLISLSAAIAALLAVPAGVPAHRVAPGRLGRRGQRDLPAADRVPALEHGPADRRGHRAVRHHRHGGGLAGGADRPARPPDLGGPAGRAARHPRLRGQLRLELAVHLDAGIPRRGDRDDARGVPAGLPAGGGEPAGGRPRPGGGRAEPRRRAGAHLHPDHAGSGQGRHPRRLPAGGPGAARRVRRLRDPRLPDLHHRDLHRARAADQVPVACALSLVLVAISLLVLAGEGWLRRGGGRVARSGPHGAARRRRRCGCGQAPRRPRWPGPACSRWPRSACRSAPASTGSSAAASPRYPAPSACPC